MSVSEDNKGFLKEKLGGYSIDPPESVWRNISSRLAGGGRRTLLILSLSAAATIALAVTLGIHYFGPEARGSRILSETNGIGPAGEPDGTAVLPQVNPDQRELQMRESPREEESSGKEVAPREEVSPLEAEVLQGGENARQDGKALQEDIARQDGNVKRDGDARQVEIARRDEESRPDNRQGRLEERVAAIVQETEVPESPEPEIPQEKVMEQRVADHPENGTVQNQESLTDDQGTVGSTEWMEEKKEGRGRWIVGAALSPLYSFRDAASVDLPEGSDVESGMIAYAGGVQVSYRAAGRLAIETGIFFNKMGISIGASGIRSYNAVPDFSPLDGAAERASWQVVSNSIGNIVSNTGDIYVNDYKLNAATESADYMGNIADETFTADEGIRQHLDYLELPFNLRYSVVDRDFELQLVGGISTNFLVNNYVTATTESGPEEIGYLSNIRSVNYAGNAGLGMVYHFHSKISLRLEPRFRYFLNSVNDATLPSTRPYSLGLYTGFSYTF